MDPKIIAIKAYLDSLREEYKEAYDNSCKRNDSYTGMEANASKIAIERVQFFVKKLEENHHGK